MVAWEMEEMVGVGIRGIKGYEGTSGGAGQAHLDCGDGFTGVQVCQHLSNRYTLCQLYLNTAVLKYVLLKEKNGNLKSYNYFIITFQTASVRTEPSRGEMPSGCWEEPRWLLQGL